MRLYPGNRNRYNFFIKSIAKGVFLLALVLCQIPGHETRLNFVALYFGNLSSTGPEAINTAMEVTLEGLSRKYPVLFANYSYISANASGIGNPCSVLAIEASVNLMRTFYNDGVLEEDQTIVLSPVCPLVFTTIGDFARVLSFGNSEITAYGIALTEMMIRFQWKSVAIINDMRGYAIRSLENCRGVLQLLQRRVLEFEFLEIKMDSGREGFSRALWAASNFSRIILSCTLGLQQHLLLATASDIGMTSGDYVFFHLYEMQVPFEQPLAWNINDTSNEKFMEALGSLFVIRSPEFPWDVISNFSKTVLLKRHTRFGTTLNPEYQFNEFMVSCYEAVEAVAKVMNESFKATPATILSSQVYSGTALARLLFNQTIALEARKLTMSDIGGRAIEVYIQQFQLPQKLFKTVLKFDSLSGRLSASEVGNNITWKFGTPPRDRPLCGVRNDRCVTSGRLVLDISLSTITTMLLLIGCLVRFMIWKRKQTALYSLWWKIEQLDVEVLAYRDSGSKHSNFPADNANEWQSKNFNQQQRKLFAKIGPSNAFASPVCELPRKSLVEITSKPFLELLRQIRDLRHQNLCMLIGLCLDAKMVTVFEDYCPRGFLDDLIDYDRLDWNIRLSLVNDLLQGISYIHKSPLKFHGNLRCSSCLIDGYLGLKVSDLYHERLASLILDVNAQSRLLENKHIWMAPEVLRSGWGSQEADIYSFSIIAHQILEQSGPYNLKATATTWNGDKTAITSIQSGCRPFFRPLFIPTVIESKQHEPLLHSLISHCWNEDPLLRPRADLIAMTIKRSQGSSQSLFDKIVCRLEIFSESLENAVAERTTQLKLEQRRCDDILTEVLPREIIQVLRQGRNVIPEMFDSATIFFSDIPEIGTLTTPMDIIAFLHKVYTLCDNVIADFEVYKVETVGDSYMVASGLPVANGDKHVFMICNMALRLTSAFRNQEKSKQLRIGIHTGPVAAAVIGKMLPRYCLFGDTVNTASRMESYGEVSKIHVSSATKEIGMLMGLEFEERGTLSIKGKGNVVTYWLTGSPEML